MKRFRRIISAVLSAAVFIICISGLIIVIASSSKGVPMIAGYGIMNVETGSMEPTYCSGDLLVITKTDASELKTGDVISFYSTDPSIYGKPNTHRIVKVSESGGQRIFTTKGDNNAAEDKYTVSEEAVIGKVVFKIPFIGKAVRFLQNSGTAFFLLIILPLIVIVIFEIRNVAIKAQEAREAESTDEKADKNQ